jgi:tetratricopeptide (TPR) repeat protein
LAAATIAVYGRVAGFDFVNYDDSEYVTKNPMVNVGLTFKGLVWAFTTPYACNWHPLTWISHMLDCQFFGLHAGGAHLVNVALHAANAVLLFLLLDRITSALWRSAIVAALFALHPMHVESVAWIAERKDVLSTFFGLLSLLAYARYVQEFKVQSSKFKIWFGVALGFFALGLMAKPMLVTLPFVMLLLDFWPLQRIENIGLRAFFSRQFGRLVLEKWPWLALAAISSAITFYIQKTGGAVVNVANFPFSWRVFTPIESYLWYTKKLFGPIHLAAYYPFERHHPIPPFLLACVFLLLVSTIAVLRIKRLPFLFVGWFWFLGVLVPVIGIVQIGSQAMADRYSYVPSIGLSIVVIWTLYEFVRGSRLKMAVAGCAAGIALAIFGAATFVQVGYWKDSITLARRAIDVSRSNEVAFMNLGVAYYDLGRDNEALDAYQASLNINPSPDVYKDLGLVLAKHNKPAEALTQYERAAQLDPKDPEAHRLMAATLRKLGKNDEALEHDEQAVRIKPQNALYQNDLGAALAAMGRKEDALARYTEAVRLDPSNAQFQNNLATALARSGQEAAAIEHYQAAIRDDPKFADPYSNLGALDVSRRRLGDAAREYSEALRLKPTNAAIYLNAGLLFVKLGRTDDATMQFARAVQIDPALADARFEYGRSLFLRGQLQPAREQLAEAVRLKPDYASGHFYLALAYVELQSLEEGLKHLQEAARLRPGWVEPLNAEAWILATSEDDKVRNGAEAVQLAETAARMTARQQPAILYTLSAAYAEAGRFDDAMASANEALDLVRRAGQTNLMAQFESALELYKSHQPFREQRKTGN